jgi:hypothetical protein
MLDFITGLSRGGHNSDFIIYLSDLVNEAIRDLVKKYKARATARQ